MSELTIRSSRGTYGVQIGTGVLAELPQPAFVLVDAAVAAQVSHLRAPTMVIEASEANKSLASCEAIMRRMREAGCVRDSSLLAVGGGMVQDVATLAASLYMRGVPWTYAPTTFMAMADSCIGGKSSINVGELKNLVGNIYPPTQVVIDLSFTRSLSDEAVASGLAEAVKICFAKGPDAFDRFVELRTSAADLSVAAGVEFLAHVLRSKQWFIETDEFDQGPRRLLNFGHTFAHALESATSFGVPHGVAVGLGVLAAIEHPDAHVTERELALAAQMKEILKPASAAVQAAGTAFDRGAFKRAFEADKKHSADGYRLILPDDGRLLEVEFPRADETVRVVTSAMERVLEQVRA